MKKIILISGSGRSGSTVLDLLIAQTDKVFSVGELMYIWDRGIKDGWKCSCGEQLLDCDTWKHILFDAYGDNYLNREFVDKMIELRAQSISIRSLFTRFFSNKDVNSRKEYCEIMNKLYSSVYKVTGCEVIVDSSKEPGNAFLLKEFSNFNVQIVHLIRSPFGVAYSWTKKVVNKAVNNKNLPTDNIVLSSLEWVITNMILLMASRKLASKVIRYEHFTDNPKGVLYSIVSHVGLPLEAAPDFITNSQVCIKEEIHSVSGNPCRFDVKNVVQIKRDSEWKEGLSLVNKIVVGIISAPLLIYLLFFYKEYEKI